VTRRRQKNRAAKTRRHAPPPIRTEPGGTTSPLAPTKAPRQVAREVDHVERLAYTRSQAAEALGISRSTLRRLLPYLETIELPWGSKLIPAGELQRVLAEQRRAATRARPARRPPGRKPSVPQELVERIASARATGASYHRIAAELNAEGVPTAHGGKRWWPSTVRAVLERAASADRAAHPAIR
jgi:DNA invertase Pin-like site-specific DNA recombinase